MWGLVGASWVVGFVLSVAQLAQMLLLPFCGPDVLNNFCDVLQVLRLACTDTSVLEFVRISSTGMLVLIWVLLLLISYAAILMMLRSHAGQARRKAASTCTSNMVSIIFIPYIYVSPDPSPPSPWTRLHSHDLHTQACDLHPEEPGDAGSSEEIRQVPSDLQQGMNLK